ncbi:MAG: hypothetical protein GTN78_19715, partial [Gemmatimonadales bacterium]|nr:hypothetical protein [Gemmatimonadales bacterium]
CGEFEVAGAVNSPGRFRLYEGDETRVSEAIQQAGRWTEDANPKSARLIHKDGSDHTIDLSQLDSDPGSAGDLLLADGDELFVPRCTAQIHVLGAVRKPGEYRVAEGTTLLEAIAIAGGPTETAVLKGCAVVRSYPERERVCADLDRLLHDGDVTQNPVLRNRDVIFLPARSPAPQSRGGVFETVAGFAGQVLRYLWIFR